MALVTEVAGYDEARGLCQAGGADACIVLVDDTATDTKPAAETEAPGRGSGVPSLMIAPSVSPHMRKAARRGGYMAVVAATIPPQMLYRRIGAALQKRRAARRQWRTRASLNVPAHGFRRQAGAFAKATIH